MRILQILPELNYGGVETGTVDLARYLKGQGHEPVVVSHGGALVATLEKHGIKHYSLPVHRKSPFTILPSIKALKKIILTEKVDIVHARSRVPAWIAYLACRRTPAEFITTCHGYYSPTFFSRIMGWAKLVIVPSDVIGRHMIESFGVAPENIRKIPRGVDRERFSVPRREEKGKSSFRVAIVGRITPLKGHTYFLQAMAKVVRTMPYVKVWIIGDVPPGREGCRQELEFLVRRLGLTESVEFLGARRDVPELLAQTDCLVFPSVQPEAFGRVILEAQAAGVPVVATKIGGAMEIVDDGKTGLLVLPKDPDAIAQAALKLLKDRRLAQELAAAAKEKLESQFTVAEMARRTVTVYEELLKTTNILVIKISSLGDVILATPSLKALRKRFPQARISCLVGKEARPVLKGCPYLDDLIVIDVRHKDQGLWPLLKFGRRLMAYKFDKVIDLQNNHKSHLLAWLCFPRESYGYDNGKWGRLLTHRVRDPRSPLSPVEHQFQVLAMLEVPYKKDGYPELWPSEKDRKAAQRLLESEWLGGEAVKMVGINVAASEKWQTKNWPVEYIARLCDILAGDNIRTVLTGTAKDREAAAAILAAAKSKPANLVGKTEILELAALIKRCKVYVTPDSAPLHIAAAMKTPFVALFGPTSSLRHLPPAKSLVVLERSLECAPCYRPECRIATHACMRDISPGEVADQVKAILKAET